MTILILLAVVAPILGFMIARMENIDTGKVPSVKDGLHGAGVALGTLGCFSFVAWLIVWMWSISLSTPPTWIDISVWLAYSVIMVAIGGLVIAVTRSRY